MTWTRLPDDYADRMALAELDDFDLAIDVQLLVWSNRLLTDGFVPAKMLQSATPLTGFPEDELLDSLRRMAKAGIWEEVPGGWQRDWSLQETAERVKTRQKLNREKQDRFRERSARCKAGDHSMCDRCEAVRNGTAAGRNRLRNSVPSRPDPTLREGREEGRTSAAPPPLGAASAPPPQEELHQKGDHSMCKPEDCQLLRQHLADDHSGCVDDFWCNDETDARVYQGISVGEFRRARDSKPLPGEQSDDWIIPKWAPGYRAQSDRLAASYHRYMDEHPNEGFRAEGAKAKSRAEQEHMWRGDCTWDDFVAHERLMMRDAGGRDGWLAAQEEDD